MTLQQAGTGYRDANKAMTIKALQDRAKAAAEFASASTQIQQPIADPLQGISHLTGVLSGQVQQGRADSAEADARQRLAMIKAQINPETGATQQQIADMSVLDPDFADKEYARAMEERAAIRNREDEQSFRTGEREAGQGFTTSERVAGEAADINKLGVTDKFADENAVRDAKIAEDAAVTADTRTDQNAIDAAKRAADEKMRQEAAETDIGPETAAREAEWKRLNPGGDINSPEAQSFILRNAAPSTGGLTSPSALKDINEFKFQGSQIDNALNTVSRAEELLNSGNVVGGDAAIWLFDKAGSIPGGPWAIKQAAQLAGYNLTDEQIAATQEFDGIMGLGATEHMANTLKGQSSNMEMQAFRRDMANRNAPDSVKRNTLQRMKNALMSDRGALDSTLQQFQQPAMNPYEYKSSSTTAPAPAATGPAAPELSDEDLLKKYR